MSQINSNLAGVVGANTQTGTGDAPQATADNQQASNQIPEAVLKAAESALALSIASITGQTVAETTALAAKYAPLAAQWGIELRQAKADNNEDALFRLNHDFKQLKVAGVLEASDYGVQLQQTSEKSFFAVLETIGHFAAASALAA